VEKQEKKTALGLDGRKEGGRSMQLSEEVTKLSVEHILDKGKLGQENKWEDDGRRRRRKRERNEIDIRGREGMMLLVECMRVDVQVIEIRIELNVL